MKQLIQKNMNFMNNRQISIWKLPQVISIVTLIAFLNLVIGCSYYKVTTTSQGAPPNKQLEDINNYVVLHQGNNAWHLTDITLNENKKEMTGKTEPLDYYHEYYKTTDPYTVNRYKARKGNPTNEIHIYISEYLEGERSSIIIPFTSISKIEIYDKAIGATVTTYACTTLGSLAGVLGVLTVIILLTKSSCPFVYISHGNTYQFKGEIYGGAVNSSLERDDYMPLPGFNPNNGLYQLKITNELLERQYTNLTELVVVQHPDNSKVIIDKNGNIQTITKPVSPVNAFSNSHIDYFNSILRQDSNSYLFNDDDNTNKSLSYLNLKFKKLANAKSCKLVLNAKNSFWLDYIYGKFNELFGVNFNKFVEKQKKVPSIEKIQWLLNQGIPLSVYVETEMGWKFVDYFNLVGPLASRDLVMPIDLTNVKGDIVNIKLECGFMFWEVDYAAMDFSENIPVDVKYITPSSAIDEKGEDVTNLLAASDDKYLIQPEVGNEVVVKYPAVSIGNDYVQSTFLHSKGYYEYIRDYKGKPNIAYLKTFRKDGAFTRFSKQSYYSFIRNNDSFTISKKNNSGK